MYHGQWKFLLFTTGCAWAIFMSILPYYATFAQQTKPQDYSIQKTENGQQFTAGQNITYKVMVQSSTTVNSCPLWFRVYNQLGERKLEKKVSFSLNSRSVVETISIANDWLEGFYKVVVVNQEGRPLAQDV